MKRVDELETRILALEQALTNFRGAFIDMMSTTASTEAKPANEKRRRSEESTTAPALYDACCETSAASS